MTELTLRSLRPSDATAALQAHRELAAEGFTFLLQGPREGEAWAAYLVRLDRQRHGLDLPDGWVPGTFLVGDVAGHLVGRVSIRHELNPWLQREGGHIGYGVRPAHRRRGYATAMLRLSLAAASGLGIERALVVCDADNAASASVIERCGGCLDDVVIGDSGQPLRRYWISTR